MVAGLLKNDVVGLPPEKTKEVHEAFTAAKTPIAVVRATALAHLYIAKRQLVGHRELEDNISLAIAQIKRLESQELGDADVMQKLSKAINKEILRDTSCDR